MLISRNSQQARNDHARGHFELIEKIVCRHLNHKLRCKH